MGIEQDRRTRRPLTRGAHETTPRDIPENVRTTVIIDGHRVQNHVSLRLIHLSQDLVFSKLVRPPQANSGEHQVSTEDRLHRHPGRLQGGLALRPNTKLLDHLPIYLRGRLAQLHGRLLLI